MLQRQYAGLWVYEVALADASSQTALVLAGAEGTVRLAEPRALA